jgi:hypothetical protein
MPADDAWGFPSGWYGAGAAGLGAGADLYAFLRAEQQRQQMQRIYQILANPQKLAEYVQRWYAPMSAAENAAVQRDLSANWSTMTGGAPGGAMSQFVADALAKTESQRYQTAASQALQAIQGAQGAIPNAPAGGNMGNILRSLLILKQIRGNQPQDGTTPGLAPIPGGSGYSGGSEAFRDQSPYPKPITELAGV